MDGRRIGVVCLLVLSLLCTREARGQIVEGGAYREQSRPEVYVISDGRKVWIPTPDALAAMGISWSQVTVVPDGALERYPRFDIPSASPTPVSLVYPPGDRFFPLPIKGGMRLKSRGREIQLATLYGWLRGVDARCGDGEDFHYALELDTDWALAQGIDLHRLLRPGAINGKGIPVPGLHQPRAKAALPLIMIELDSWGRGGVASLFSKPADWKYAAGDANCHLQFAYDPYQPRGSGPRLDAFEPNLSRRGPYVRVSGSLVTDDPHDGAGVFHTLLSRFLGWSATEDAEWRASARDWLPGVERTTPDHPARWPEIHPPDLIEVIDDRQPRVTVRGVGLVARPGINACEGVEFEIRPEAARPANAQIAYEELRGPETFWPWGENSDNGSWVTVMDDRIKVKARVCGALGTLGVGSPGRFKALYRVWWKETPAGQPAARTGSFVTAHRDEIRYVIEPNVAASTGVEFRLCLGRGITWEKRMNLPDGQGSSWNLVVKDQKVCDTNSLWANQVTNGQSLTFFKARTFGVVRQVHAIPMSTLGPLPGGSRVTFTWLRD